MRRQIRKCSCPKGGIDVGGQRYQIYSNESGRDRERHQREDVEAVSEQIHHGEAWPWLAGWP